MSGSSEFWRFSLSFYGDGLVAEACLRLQDEAGADVNMLLFLLWRASNRRSLSQEEITAVDRAIAGWRREVVVPLRGVRRFLKHPPASVEAQAAHDLRQQVKRIELESERLQQEAMAALADEVAAGAPAPSAGSAAQASLAAYEAVHKRALPQDVLKVLLDKLAARGEASPETSSAGETNGR